MRPTSLVCALALLLCLTLGGATRPGHLSDAALQLLSVPFLVYGLWIWLRRPASGPPAPAVPVVLALFAVLAACHLLQLIPLPPQVWTLLPGRRLVVEGLDLAGAPLQWLPVSLTPRETWISLLSLLPPASVALLAAQLGYRDRRLVTLVLLAFGVLCVALGVLQLAQGPASPLRPFPITNPTEAVGFFANRNHFAALIYTMLALIAAWTTLEVSELASAIRERDPDMRVILRALACLTAIALFIAAVAMARSRAGLALALLAVLGGLVILPLSERTRRSGRGFGIILPLLLLAVLSASQYGVYRVMERFEVGVDLSRDTRLVFARNTLAAIRDFAPIGSGFGSFPTVHGVYERPNETISAYANRAHNDLLEWTLEGGVPVVLFILVLGVLMLRRFIAVWRTAPDDLHRIDKLLRRAAALAVLLLAIHSALDYPLRTTALASLFAFTGTLLLPGMHVGRDAPDGNGDRRGKRRGVRKGRSLPAADAVSSRAGQTPMSQTAATNSPPAPTSSPVGGKWGAGLQWPQEWRAPQSPSAASPEFPASVRDDEPR